MYICSLEWQKHPFKGVFGKRCSENAQQIYRRTPMPKGDFCNFIEIALWHGFSPVNQLHIFRTPFFKNTSGELLLEWLLCAVSEFRETCRVLEENFLGAGLYFSAVQNSKQGLNVTFTLIKLNQVSINHNFHRKIKSGNIFGITQQCNGIYIEGHQLSLLPSKYVSFKAMNLISAAINYKK